MTFSFSNCKVDLSTFELERRGRVVKIEPKVFDVLVYLIENRDRVVTKNELLDTLWPGEAVSDSVLPRCVAAARRAVGDTRTKQRVIQTVHGRGYRFVAELIAATPEAIEPAPRETNASVRTKAAPATEAVKSDFVGRSSAMKKLKSALGRAEQADGNVALVVGEPGIGKTRIASELIDLAAARGAEVLIGRCYEGEGAPAYWPWIQVLRSAIGSCPDDILATTLGASASDLAELLPELRDRLPNVPESVGPGGDQARFRLFDAATRFLVARAVDVPLLIVIDDLHWADASSLGLLRFLASQLSNHRILLLGTYRDVEVRRGHPLADTLGSLAREAHCERVHLTGLRTQEIESFVALQAEAPVRTGLAEKLREMTDGNPFFLREMVQLLADQEEISGADPASLHALTLPQGVRDAVGRRLSALSEECNAMLRAAAVLGRTFAINTLEHTLTIADEAAKDRILELIGEALDAGAILESGRGEYSFVHALTRQTLYDELRAPQRIALHRRAGTALEATLGNRVEAHIAEIAHHFFEAAPGGDVDKAIACAVTAAEVAHKQHAYDEAVQQYERAVEALDLILPDPEERRAELLLALGNELFTTASLDAAYDRFFQTADIARRIGRSDLLARAAIGIRGFGEMGAPAAKGVIELLQEALEAIDEEEIALRSMLLTRLSAIGVSTMETRERLSLEALELAKRSGDPIALRDAYSSRWWATLGPDQIEERLEIASAMQEIAREANDARCLMFSYECSLGAYLLLGSKTKIFEILDEYKEIAESIRQPIFIFMEKMMRIACLMNSGRFDEAETLRVEAEAYGKGRVPFAEVASQGQLHWAIFHRGGTSDSEIHDSALLLNDRIQNYISNLAAGKLFGAMVKWNQRHDLDVGREIVAEVDYRTLERDEHWLLAMGILSDIAFAVDDRALMQELYDTLFPYRELMLVHDLLRACSGSVHSCLGELATGLGRLDLAIEHYERSIEREIESGTTSAVPSSELGLARALAERGGAPDLERARKICEERSREPEGSMGAILTRDLAQLRARLSG